MLRQKYARSDVKIVYYLQLVAKLILDESCQHLFRPPSPLLVFVKHFFLMRERAKRLYIIFWSKNFRKVAVSYLGNICFGRRRKVQSDFHVDIALA